MVLTQSNMLPLGTDLPEIDLNNCKGNRYIQPQEDKIGFVVAFICNHCPYVISIKEVMSDILNKAMNQNFEVVAINSNDWRSYPDDSPENMIIDAEKYNYNFPYLIDETQDTARTFLAACTPEFYVFNSEKKLIYRGRFDESTPGNHKEVNGKDLIEAIKSVKNNYNSDRDQIPSIGCNIKWKN
ncbi:MAG: thioredoxin family protein [Pseudomonadota bacterium]|nr:thioredoxin family protein [Pseudomonadota bacterium]